MAGNDFLATYAPLANDIATQTGVDPAVVLGIIDVETDGGKHVKGNNIFGISPGGKVASYPDVETASRAFVTLMQTPRYAGVAAAAPEQQAAALVKSGYNTVNPNYARLVGGSATSIGKQLGYQDGGTTPQTSTAQPAAQSELDRALTSLTPTKEQPAAAPAAKPAEQQSEVDKALSSLPTPKGETTEEKPPQSTDQAIAGTVSAEAAPSLVTPAGVGRIIQAGKEGWEGVTLPRVPSQYVTAPIYNPLIAGAETVLGAGSALLRGGQQTVQEVLNPLNPQLARDVAAIPEAFPFGMRNFGGRPVIPDAPKAPPTPRFAGEIPVTPAERAANAEVLAAQPDYAPSVNALSPEAAARSNVRAATTADRTPAPASPTGVERIPVPETPPAQVAVPEADARWISDTKGRIEQLVRENAEVGGPKDLSAAASPPGAGALTPAQTKAYRRMAELKRAVDPISGEDTTEYVFGSNPTNAERKGVATVSQQERLVREQNPDAFDGPNGALTKNNEARLKAFDDHLMSDAQAADLKEQQQAAAAADRTRLLAKAKDMDLNGAARWVDEMLADPGVQEVKDVRNVLTELRKTLYDADGNLKTDPRAGWGMHDNLRNMLDKAKDPMNATASEKYAVNVINQFKKHVDAAMTVATDGGFQGFLDTQSKFLSQLHAWELLHKFRNTQMINRRTGMINTNAFQKFTTDLAMRRGRPGIDPAMDIPDEVMQTILNINDDLKRAARIDLGSSRGSHTHLMFELSKALGLAGAHALVGTHTGPVGNILFQQGVGALEQRMARRRLNRLTQRALPPASDLNPLNPP